MIRVEGLTVALGDRRLFHGLDASFGSGRVTGIVGPNGSGKSTLLRALGAEEKPHAGSVFYGEVDAHRLDSRGRAQRRAMLFQSSEVTFDFTVRELLDMGAFPFGDHGLPDAKSVAERVGMAPLLGRSVRELSGGERQRALLGCALGQAELSREAHPILLLDEPVAHQDPGWQLSIFELLRACADRGFVVVVVVHDLSLAGRYCDELLLLSNGAEAAHGPAVEVLASRALEDAFGVRVSTVVDGLGETRIFVEKAPSPEKS